MKAVVIPPFYLLNYIYLHNSILPIIRQAHIIMCIMGIKIDEIDKKVGMNIRIFRIKRELSQEGLAYMAGIGTSTMVIVERGEQSPSIQTLAKTANALNIDIHKLFIFRISRNFIQQKPSY